MRTPISALLVLAASASLSSLTREAKAELTVIDVDISGEVYSFAQPFTGPGAVSSSDSFTWPDSSATCGFVSSPAFPLTASANASFTATPHSLTVDVGNYLISYDHSAWHIYGHSYVDLDITFHVSSPVVAQVDYTGTGRGFGLYGEEGYIAGWWPTTVPQSLPKSVELSVGDYRIRAYSHFTMDNIDGGQSLSMESGTYSDSITFTDVPEPASLGLLACGAASLLIRRRKQA